MYKGCRWLCLALSALLALPPAVWAQEAQAQPQPQSQPQSIRILVLAGQDAINNVETKGATQPVVEIQDDSGTPVAGAEVVFSTPPTGPSATFYGATRTTTLTTDEHGRAAVSGMTANTDLGAFEIQVTATHESLQAETVIRQTNAEPAGMAKKKKGLGWRLLAAIGAGAAIGVIAAVRRDNDSVTSATPTAITFGSISVGTPK